MSMLQKVLSDIFEMSSDELKRYIKDLSKEDRININISMGLNKTSSQKKLCNEIEKTASFLKDARR